jgi:two-component system KDP operon response regulator KdpE
MSAGRILVVDDEPQVRRVMRTTLTVRGYEVGDARTGEEALEKVRQETYDLVLLDMNLPGMGGIETCRALRAGSDIGIIMLTVRDSEKDKIEALDAGADDYVTKPFSSPELLARIRATMRRSPTALEPGPKLLRLGEIEIDFQARHVRTAEASLHLTPKQFELLRYLASHPNKAVSFRCP